MNDAELRQLRSEHCTFNGTAYVFADGVDFENVRAAIQAAFLAKEYHVALDIARRYRLDEVLCLRCVMHRVPCRPTHVAASSIYRYFCETCVSVTLHREQMALTTAYVEAVKTIK